jgi:hypothetical protein
MASLSRLINNEEMGMIDDANVGSYTTLEIS